VTTPEQPADATPEVLPPLVVVSGEATEEEVAALTAVVAALGAAQSSAQSSVPPPRPVSQWAARSRQVRGPHHAGPGGWRTSTLPR
jgi:hypothetical protein